MTTVLNTIAPSTCGLKPANLPRATPISVNGTPIPKDAISRETQNHPAAKPVEAWLAAARALVVRELLLQEARRLQVVAEPREDDSGRQETPDEALIRALIETQIAVPTADEAACRRIYDQQCARFRSSDLYEVRHILLAARPGDAAARAEARSTAHQIIATLAAEPLSFAAMAKQHSVCPSAVTGGNLGQISHGQTVPEFEAALSQLPRGTVAPEPVETRYGWHVVTVDRHIAGQQLPFAAVRAGIARWLEAKARHEAIRQYIGFLGRSAVIEGIALEATGQSASAGV
jgi:peptidyl-prolyl cis-trans isomerase C